GDRQRCGACGHLQKAAAWKCHGTPSSARTSGKTSGSGRCLEGRNRRWGQAARDAMRLPRRNPHPCRGHAMTSLIGRMKNSDSEAGPLLLCTVLLVAAALSASLIFACAAPFAAFAALAAGVLSRRNALLAIAAAWLANQAIGFGVLGYPHGLTTMIW